MQDPRPTKEHSPSYLRPVGDALHQRVRHNQREGAQAQFQGRGVQTGHPCNANGQLEEEKHCARGLGGAGKGSVRRERPRQSPVHVAQQVGRLIPGPSRINLTGPAACATPSPTRPSTGPGKGCGPELHLIQGKKTTMSRASTCGLLCSDKSCREGPGSGAFHASIQVPIADVVDGASRSAQHKRSNCKRCQRGDVREGAVGGSQGDRPETGPEQEPGSCQRGRG